jgi:hypothetical protein
MMRHWVQRVLAQTAFMAVVFCVFTSLLSFSPHADAAINQQINFQGKLTNPNGTNVANGNYSIVFSLYTVPSAGTAVWTETQSSVAVTDGVFQVALGSSTALPGSVDFNNSSLYLGVKVGADAEMNPRVRFTAAPYAFNSDRLNGLQSSAFGQLTANNTFTGTNTVQGTNNAQFVIQNAGIQTLFIANTSTQQVAIGPAAQPANGVLTVGVNSIDALGGLYFGTDSNLYRSGANALTTDSALTVKGGATIGTGTGTALFQSWFTGNSAFWIDMPTTGPSGIGSGGAGTNPWIAYASGAGQWFTDSAAGDIIYRNTSGNLLFGNTAGLSAFAITTNALQVGQATTDAAAILLKLDSYNQATDPTGTNGSTYYNTNRAKFRCYENGAWKDCITKEMWTRSFIDTTVDAAVDANTTNYWDLAAENNNSYPNITPSSTTKSVWVLVTMETVSTGVADVEITARVERSTGAVPAACGSGTIVGSQPGTFATNTNARKTSTAQSIDTPATTSKVWYVLCSDTDTVGTTASISRIRITLFEVDNSNI